MSAVLITLGIALILAVVYWAGEARGRAVGYSAGFQDGYGARWGQPGTPGDAP